MRKLLNRAGAPPVRKRRHKLATGASLASAAAICLAWAGTAGAASTPPVNATVVSPANGDTYSLPGSTPANNFIIGSGSATTYDMMQALDGLFNNVPGCVITTSSFTYVAGKGSQELNYSCLNSGATTPSGVTPSVTAEQIPSNVGNNEEYAYLDNPVNDVALSQPPMGSSTGIEQIENARNNGSSGSGIGATNATENVTGANYARSSRVPGGSDVQGLNFVAYAVDGVSWIHFTKTSAGATPSGHISGLTQTQIQGIYNGTIWNWGQIPGGKPGNIVVYSAQEGSGTQSTWKGFAGSSAAADPSGPTNPVNCATEPAITGHGSSTVYGAGPGTNCAGPKDIFENELTSVSSADYADMIFFYSVGKYNAQCAGVKEKVSSGVDKTLIAQQTLNTKVGSGCGGSPTVGGAGKIVLGSINNAAPTPTNVLSGAFAPIRDLYNVYSNGSNAGVPAATPATLNYVSEVGFVCKPQTVDGTTNAAVSNQIEDPATGSWYELEIDNTILSQGFIPLAATDTGTTYSTLAFPAAPNAAEGSVPHDAASLLASSAGGATYLDAGMPGGGSGNTTIPTAANPDGFCAVSTTDGNANQ